MTAVTYPISIPRPNQKPFRMDYSSATTVVQRMKRGFAVVDTSAVEAVASSDLMPIASDSSTAPSGHALIQGRLRELEKIARIDYGLSGIDSKSESVLGQLVDVIGGAPELRGILDQAFISLIFEGELQIEWGHAGRYLEIELRRDGSLRALAELRGIVYSSTLWETEQVVAALVWLGLDSV